MNVVERFAIVLIDVTDAQVVTFGNVVEFIRIGWTPMLSALMISAACASNQ